MKPTKADDRKLAKWIKKICQTRKLPDGIEIDTSRQYKLEDSIGLDRCEIRLVPLVGCLIRPKETEQPLDFAHELASAGYSKSAETFVEGNLSEFGSLKLKQLLPYLGDFRVLEKWRKIADAPLQAVNEELRELLANDPPLVAIDWLLQKSKPEDLKSEYSWLLREMMTVNEPASERLINYLSKDPQGNRLAIVLSVASAEEIAALAKVIANSNSSIASFVEVIPLLSTNPKETYPLAEIIEGVFGNMHEVSKPPARAYQSAALAKLTAALLMEGRLNESGQQALSTTSEIAKQIANLQLSEELAANTWVLQTCLQQQQSGADAGFTQKGARQWALTYENARLNGHDLANLHMLARNCGLTTIETANEVVTFDSKKHHDTQGGLLPGDQALIQHSGWVLDDTILIRANVKRTDNK